MRRLGFGIPFGLYLCTANSIMVISVMGHKSMKKSFNLMGYHYLQFNGPSTVSKNEFKLGPHLLEAQMDCHYSIRLRNRVFVYKKRVVEIKPL